MPHVAILTMDSLEDFFAYDNMLDEPMRLAGWQTQHVSWRDASVDWNRFDVVIVRSPWDYQDDANAFLACLNNIEQSRAVLENPYSLMRWNIAKTYLCDLNEQGVPIVPTLWFEHYKPDMLSQGFASFNVDTLIVKPVVSANADHTYRITSEEIGTHTDSLKSVFADRALMIQPFLPSVLLPGEFSLFYFDHQYSHAILKTPKADDFRVQEEHGGRLTAVEPTAQMCSVAEQTLAALPQRALYARVDLIETDQGLAVMEVELIEPSLYFDMDDSSAQRFTNVFVQKYAHIAQSSTR